MPNASPITDIAAGGWTASTGSSLSAVVDEAVADDTDFITASVAATCEMKLGPLTDPGVDTGFSLKYRALSELGTETMGIALKQGNLILAEESRTLTTSAAEYAFAVPEAAVAKITDWSDLRVLLDYPATASGTALLLDFKNGVYRQTRTRTNSIRNSTMVGAVAGTPGTLPTNWNIPAIAGISTSVVGTGTTTYQGKSYTYIDVRMNGTNSTGASQFPDIKFEAANSVPALNGQTWTASCFMALVAGSFTGPTAGTGPQIALVFRDASGTILTQGGAVTLNVGSTPVHASQVLTATNASTAFIQPRFYVGTVPNGTAIDFTVRLFGMQLEKSSTYSAFIPTSGSAASVTESVSETTVARVNLFNWSNDYGQSLQKTDTTISYAGQASGTELVTNGGFDTDLSGWTDASTAPSTVAWSSGTAAFTGDGTNNSRLRQSFATTPGVSYRLSSTIATNTVLYVVGSTLGGSDIFAGGVVGANSAIFVAKTTTTYIQFYRSATGTGTVDNVSLQELIPIAAPSGEPLALLTEGSAGTALLGNFASTYQPSVTATYSCVVKRGNHDWVRIFLSDSTGSHTGRVWINLATGALGSTSYGGTLVTSASGAVTALGDGFYRISITATIATTASASINAYTASATADGSTSRVAGGTRYQGLSHLEIGSTATAYVGPTNAVTTTTNNRAIAGLFGLYGKSYTRSGAKGELSSTGSILWTPPNIPLVVPGVGLWSRTAVTNLLLRSQEFDNASWTKRSSTVSANTTAAPDGSLTADTITASGGGEAAASISATASASTVYTASIFFKAGTSTVGYLQINNQDNTHAFWIPYNLSTGAVGSAASIIGGGFSAVSGTIIAAGNGFYRCNVTFTTPASTTAVTVYNALSDSTASRSVTAGKTIHAWQASLYAGNYPDGGPLIVTTSATAATGADVAFLNSPITADEDFVMWAIANLPASTGTSDRPFGITDGTSSNRLWVERGTTGSLLAQAVAGGTFLGFTGTGVTQTGAGRAVILCRRRAGKWSSGAKNSAGTVGLSSEITAAFPSSLWRGEVGQILNANHSNGPVELATIRRGTFSDADLTSILTAA